MNKRPVVTRRNVLGTLGALGLTAGLSPRGTAGEPARIKLRLLETSDLHMFVLDWDYYRAKEDSTVGFASVATLIREARRETRNALLFDNGDFLQGTPLADYVAEKAQLSSSTSPHPIVAIMRDLGYDAAGLGNHEFNYGLDFLEASLARSTFPFVCANVTRVGGQAFMPPYTILEREVADTSGTLHQLKIGVIGFVPPQIMVWDKSRLEGKLEAGDIVLAAKSHISELRQKCDLLVALCHSGIKTGVWVEGEENAAFHLSAVPGIDVIMTGHSHRVFPGQDFVGLEGVDAIAGRLNGVPAVMPGFWGSHLGVIDLVLEREAERWRVADAHVETRPVYRRAEGRVEPLVRRDADVAAAIAPLHDATRVWVDQPVGQVDRPVHSYLVWAGYDPATAIVNAAQIGYARPLLAEAGLGDLPLLSAAAPFRVGYTPDSFVDVAKGAVTLRDAASLYMYSNNTVVVVRVTGAQVREWLEYAARAFHTIDPEGKTPQALIEKRIPSYNFDTFSGLTYKIDVTQPSRYSANGVIDEKARRIVDLTYAGAPLDLDREFLVVTNNYRADGGGNFPSLAQAKIVLRAPDTNRDAVLRLFRSKETVAVSQEPRWRFASTGREIVVWFDSGKSAVNHLADAANATVVGDSEPGYTRVALKLE